MTQIDEKAMEAARNECNAPWSSYSVRDIIEAYLSALPPPAGEVGELVERLREWGTGDDGWVRIDEAAAEACEQAADALSSLSARLAKAERYAERLAVALAARHYPEADMWRPLSGDLLGLLTQIDNMTTGLSRTARAALSPTPAGGQETECHMLINGKDEAARLAILRSSLPATPAKGARDE